MAKAWGSPTHRVHVWIDGDGLIRREETSYSFIEAGETVRARVLLDFMDVGSPQEIARPDDDGVVDLTDEFAERLGEG